MSQRVKSVSGWIVGALAAGALAFGSSVAFAKPANAMTCNNDGWNWLGYKPTQEACFTACEALHGPHVQIQYGAQGCCTCLF